MFALLRLAVRVGTYLRRALEGLYESRMKLMGTIAAGCRATNPPSIVRNPVNHGLFT